MEGYTRIVFQVAKLLDILALHKKLIKKLFHRAFLFVAVGNVGPSGAVTHTLPGGGVNDFGSIDEVGIGTSESFTGSASTGLDEFPTIGLPPGLVDKQGYKVMHVGCASMKTITQLVKKKEKAFSNQYKT